MYTFKKTSFLFFTPLIFHWANYTLNKTYPLIIYFPSIFSFPSLTKLSPYFYFPLFFNLHP